MPQSSREPFHITLYAAKLNALKVVQHKLNFDPSLDHHEFTVKKNYITSTTAIRKNVVVIVVDALRPDHMGVYGYERDTTPYLSELAKKGVLTVVHNVHASCGESACGLSSISSSKYPHQLPTTPFTLQQVLKQYGYETRMILGGDHTNFYNLRTMYGKVDGYYDGSMAKRQYMNDDILVTEKVDALESWNGNPVMFQFHLMSVHRLGKRWPNFSAFTPQTGYTSGMNGSPKMEHTNYYDNGVQQADSVIKTLLSTLQSKSYLKNSLIVVTGDHGDSLGEHGLYSHANSVYEELLRIPFLLIDFTKINNSYKVPHIDTKKFTSQVDIAPTILHDLKMTIPTNWSGQPVQILPKDGKKLDYTFFQLRPFVGLYDHSKSGELWKYWAHTFTNEEFVFDLTNDPAESKNLAISTDTRQLQIWRDLAYKTKLD